MLIPEPVLAVYDLARLGEGEFSKNGPWSKSSSTTWLSGLATSLQPLLVLKLNLGVQLL
jgi:hypothetical protein